MGRPTTGPRRNSKNNPTLYAFLKHSDKVYKESLRTTDKGVALDRYPAAMRRLKLKAQGIKPVELIKPTDPAIDWQFTKQRAAVNLIYPQQLSGEYKIGSNTFYKEITQLQGPPERQVIGEEISIQECLDSAVPVETTLGEILDPEAFVISWEAALAIHIQRQEEKRGRAISQGTLKGMRYAIADISAAPGEVTTQDVRDFMAKLKARGLAALTISQRASLLQGITQTLVKQDLIESNSWQRVDFSAKSKKHIREATREEVQTIVDAGHTPLITLAFTGMRVGELVSRDKKHLKDGWLTINDTATWRPKSEGSERRLPIPERINLELPTWKKSKLDNDIKALCPGLSCHGLRHAFKTAIRESGIPFDLGEFLMGHATPGGDISSRYGSFSDEAVLSASTRVWAVINEWIK